MKLRSRRHKANKRKSFLQCLLSTNISQELKIVFFKELDWFSCLPKAQETVIAFSLQKLFVSSYSVSLLALREDCFWVLFLKPSGRPNAHFHFQFYFHQLQGNKKKKVPKGICFSLRTPKYPSHFLSALPAWHSCKQEKVKDSDNNKTFYKHSCYAFFVAEES